MTTEMKKASDSEFDFLPAAGQMKLTEIQKAQINRVRTKVMEELKSLLGRVHLTMDEYSTAENELKTCESPDSEFEAEEEKRKMRERKMKRKERRAKRKMDLPEEKEGKEERNGRDVQRETADQTTTLGIEDSEKGGEEGSTPESYGDSSGSSSEEDKDNDGEDADGKETKQETWTAPGQVQRRVSRNTLLRVSEKIQGTFQEIEILLVASVLQKPG